MPELEYLILAVRTAEYRISDTGCTYGRIQNIWYWLYVRQNRGYLILAVRTAEYRISDTGCMYGRIQNIWYWLYVRQNREYLILAVRTAEYRISDIGCTYGRIQDIWYWLYVRQNRGYLILAVRTAEYRISDIGCTYGRIQNIWYWLYVRQNTESSSGVDFTHWCKIFRYFVYGGCLPLVTLVPCDVILVFRKHQWTGTRHSYTGSQSRRLLLVPAACASTTVIGVLRLFTRN
jgi:hypothetical protein